MIYNECDIIQIDEDCEIVSPNKMEESTSRPKNMRDYHQAYGRKHPNPSAIAKSTKIPKSNKIPRSNIIAKPWRMEDEPFLLDANNFHCMKSETEKKTSTERVRLFSEKKRVNKPPKNPPKTNIERNREYRARKKASRIYSGKYELLTIPNTLNESIWIPVLSERTASGIENLNATDTREDTYGVRDQRNESDSAEQLINTTASTSALNAKFTFVQPSHRIFEKQIFSNPPASSNSILYNLIAFVVSDPKGPNLDFIDELRQEMVTKLIQLFSNKHLQTNHHKILNNRVFKKLNKTIDESFLKYALRQWKGWKLYDFKSVTNEISDNLCMYLKSCFKDFFGLKEKFLRDELKEYEKNNEDAMLVFSSLCDLKTLFHHEPHKFSTYFRDLGVLKNNTASEHVCPTPVQLLNWPYVSTQVVFPHFKMIHQNINTNKFKLIDLKRGYEPFTGEPQNMNLHYQPSSNTKTLPSSLIASFIGQLKNVVNVKYPFQSMKAELIDILTEFEKDIALCSNNIETNTHYYQNFSAYPYVRYLGMPTQGNAPVISPFDQTVIKDSQVNVRLQQLAFPGVSFNLELFEMSRNEEDESGKERFFFKGNFFRMIKDNIIYTCTLCNTTFKASSALIFHLSELHGVEPDWKCAMCNVYFTTRYLSSRRWQHKCKFV